MHLKPKNVSCDCKYHAISAEHNLMQLEIPRDNVYILFQESFNAQTYPSYGIAHKLASVLT